MPTPSDLSDRPVFVDPSGRRRRLVRRIAIAACSALAVYVILLCAALSGAPIPPSALLPLPAAPSDTGTSTTDDQPVQPANQAGGAVTTAAGVTQTTALSLKPTTASQPTVTTTANTTTTTTTTRNSHAPITPPGHTKHTDTTAPGP